MTDFIRAQLDTIEASTTNPRKHFDAGDESRDKTIDHCVKQLSDRSRL